MGRLVWDKVGERFYETGTDRGVLYVQDDGTYGTGVAWNGLTAVSENPSGAEASALYADNIKYLNLISNEEFGMTIEAYTYPDAFAECDGSYQIAAGVMAGQQKRKQFGFTYRTKIGNDTDGDDKGYKIHIVYNCQAAPTDRSYATVNDSPEAMSFSWEVTTTPVEIGDGYRPTAHLEIDSTKVTDETKLAALEAKLYGVTADAFDQTKTYAVGDYVTHTEDTTTKTYVCKTAITTAAAWDGSKWTEVDDGPALPTPAEVMEIMGAVPTV